MADTTIYTSIHTGAAIDAAVTRIQELVLPNLEGYATEEYVDNAVANITIPDNLATEEYVNTAIANINLPDDLATESYVDESIDAITPASIGAATTSALNNYLPLTGGTVTGQITLKNTTATPTKGQILPALNVSYQNGAGTYYSGSVIDMVGTANTSETYNLSVRLGSPSGTTIISSGESGKTMPAAIPLADDEHIYLISDGSIIFYPGASNDATSYTKALTVTKTRIDSHVPFYGAVYNDYAEFREAYADPGRCVVENGDGTLRLSRERLEPAPEIISDTFGFAIGETEKCKAPIAIAGRVLAYPYEPKEEFKAGNPVCSGPDGTISKMTREEVCMYPDRIIGTVSEIPTYDTWGQNNIIVDGRIWIRIR